MKKKTLLTSLMSIAMLASITTGATYALFTAEDTANIAITSAKVKVEAKVLEDFAIKSLDTDLTNVNGSGTFSTGGTATVSNGDIKLDRMVPGDRVEFKVQINNLSNVDVAYKVYAVVDGELVESLEFTQLATKEYSSWKSLPYTGVEAVETINCVVELPESVGNEYQEKTANIKIVVEAVQGNAVSTFDGAEPTDPVAALAEVTDVTTKEVSIDNPSILAAFRTVVNSGEKYEGYTVKLTDDLDFNNIPWTPIGSNADNSSINFSGTFDGNGHTISHLYVKQDEGYHGAGLFGAINSTATIKNLVVDGAYVESLSSGSATVNGAATVVGSMGYGGTVSGVTVRNSVIKGNRMLGGIASYVAGTVENCTVENVTLIATPDNLTDSYDNGDKVGGIVSNTNTAVKIDGNRVKNLTAKGYRDIGGIVGAANQGVVTNNTVEGEINLHVDQVTNHYGPKDENVGSIVGRFLSSGELGSGNDDSNATINITRDLLVGKANEESKLEDVLNDAEGDVEVNVAKDAEVSWTTGAGIGSTPFTNTGDVTIEGLEGSKFVALGSGVGPVAASSGNTLTMKNLTIVDNSVSYAEGSWEYGYLEFAGKLRFENCVFENAIMIEGDAEATFINCTFNSHHDNEYAVWVGDGTASFEGCTFEGARGLKMHEAYGSDVTAVYVNGCQFGPLTKKPGIAIGTINSTTVVKITNSTFTGCQAGDQGLYMYETDTDVTTFNFTESGNTIN